MQQKPQAVRLTFTYKGAVVSLAGSEVIEKVVRASDARLAEAPVSGFWFELQDNASHRVFQRTMRSPIRHEHEVFSPDGAIRNVPIAAPTGSFSIVVPLLPLATSLVLHDSPSPAVGRHLAARSIARFDVSEIMKRAAAP